jgi:hypothetical protein
LGKAVTADEKQPLPVTRKDVEEFSIPQVGQFDPAIAVLASAV